MVRVGGGWMALDEFLVKNDPCRGNFSNNLKSKINQVYLEYVKYEYDVIICHLVLSVINFTIHD